MLQKNGHEFGATTGRSRRCGWFDAVVARHSARISGIDAWNLTKLDVLTGIEEIKVVVDYSLDGKKLFSFPDHISSLEKITTETIVLPGWEEDIRHCKTFHELPKNAQKYCQVIVEVTGVPIHSIGTGPERGDLIILDA
jgi:adenylosuccinate synthase